MNKDNDAWDQDGCPEDHDDTDTGSLVPRQEWFGSLAIAVAGFLGIQALLYVNIPQYLLFWVEASTVSGPWWALLASGMYGFSGTLSESLVRLGPLMLMLGMIWTGKGGLQRDLSFIVARLVGLVGLTLFLGTTLVVPGTMAGLVAPGLTLVLAFAFLLGQSGRYIALEQLLERLQALKSKWVYFIIAGLGALVSIASAGLDQTIRESVTRVADPWLGLGMILSYVVGSVPILLGLAQGARFVAHGKHRWLTRSIALISMFIGLASVVAILRTA